MDRLRGLRGLRPQTDSRFALGIGPIPVIWCPSCAVVIRLVGQRLVFFAALRLIATDQGPFLQPRSGDCVQGHRHCKEIWGDVSPAQVWRTQPCLPPENDPHGDWDRGITARGCYGNARRCTAERTSHAVPINARTLQCSWCKMGVDEVSCGRTSPAVRFKRGFTGNINFNSRNRPTNA